MGDFIGHIGGFLMLAAVIMLAGIFTAEAGIVKDKSVLKENGKIAVFVTVIGMLYYFFMAYLKNVISGQINIFDFGSIFTFAGIDKLIGLYENFNIKDSMAGMSMPLFPALVHLIGKVIFEQYCGTAVWLNFLSVAAGMCCLYRMSCDFFGKRTAQQTVFYILLIPYAFLLFSPGSWGAAIGLVFASAYALYRKNNILYIILGLLAVCMNKLGLLFIVPLVLSIMDFGKTLKKAAENNMFAKKPYLSRILLYLLFMLDAFLMFMMIGGK
ncbi:MAG: hypothetical protein ACI38A_03005 [Candidatus Ornithomonoglobus sp.]